MEIKIHKHDAGHTTKMTAMPIYVNNLEKVKPVDFQHYCSLLPGK